MGDRSRHPFWVLAGLSLGIALAQRVEKRRHLKETQNAFVSRTVLIDLSFAPTTQVAAFATAERGASLILLSTNKRTLKIAKKNLVKNQLQQSIFTIQLPDTTPESYRQAVETALKQVGSIDILLNIIEGDQETDFVQLQTAIELTRLVMRNMVERSHGVLTYIPINTSGVINNQLEQFCDALRGEVRSAGLDVLAVQANAATAMPQEMLIRFILDAIALDKKDISVGLLARIEAHLTHRYPSVVKAFWKALLGDEP